MVLTVDRNAHIISIMNNSNHVHIWNVMSKLHEGNQRTQLFYAICLDIKGSVKIWVVNWSLFRWALNFDIWVWFVIFMKTDAFHWFDVSWIIIIKCLTAWRSRVNLHETRTTISFMSTSQNCSSHPNSLMPSYWMKSDVPTNFYYRV